MRAIPPRRAQRCAPGNLNAKGNVPYRKSPRVPTKTSHPSHHVAKYRLWIPYQANRKKAARPTAITRPLQSCLAISVWPGVKVTAEIPEIAEAIHVAQKKR